MTAQNDGTEPVVFNLDSADPGFKDEIAREPGGEGIYRCYACGTCVAGRPVRDVSDKYNPRRIIHMALLGMRKEVLESDFIWLCSTCFTCQERCPQDVKVTDLITALRNIAAREGKYPEAYKMQKDLILEMARLYEIDDFDNKKRGKVGLPAIIMDSEELNVLFKSLEEESS